MSSPRRLNPFPADSNRGVVLGDGSTAMFPQSRGIPVDEVAKLLVGIDAQGNPVAPFCPNSGGKYIAAATSATGNWGGFLALTDTVLDSTTVCDITGLAESGATIPAGTYVPGNFTVIKTSSGVGIAYQ